MKQSGEGHFVPIGGLSIEDEMVFLFDTARFKYPPHWITLKLLYESIYAKRGDGLGRGFILATLLPRTCSSIDTREPKLPKCDIDKLFTAWKKGKVQNRGSF